MDPLFSYGLAAGITLFLAHLLQPAAHHVGLIDHPTKRKRHHGPVPLVGGMAMFCGFSFGVLTVDFAIGGYRPLFAGCLLLMVVGVLDDLRELSARDKFIAQIIAGFMMTLWGGVYLADLGQLLMPDHILTLYWFAIPFTVFALVGGINAFNMIDGIDGLASGLAIIALAGMAWMASQAGMANVAQLILIALACVTAFWLLNMRFPWQAHARIFMGDAGSMFVGFMVAWFLIVLSQGDNRAMPPVLALYLFGLPVMDTLFVFARRLASRKPPFDPDRMHIHHLALRWGIPVRWASSIILATAAVIALLGLLAVHTGFAESTLFWTWMGLCAVYFASAHWLWQKLAKRL